MNNKNYNFVILIVFIALTPGNLVYPDSQDIDKTIEYKSEELGKIRNEISQYKRDLESTKSKEKSILAKLQEVEKEISLTEKMILQLSREQKQKEDEIQSLINSIHQLEEDLEELKENFANRLVKIYKEGDMSDWELILSSQSINQAIYRYKYLKIISDIDRKTAKGIKLGIRKTENSKMKLAEELKDKEKIAAEKRKYQASLSSQKSEREKQLSRAKKDKATLLAQINEKEKAAAELSELIATLEQEREERLKELARHRERSGIKKENPFLTDQGQFMWPVEGEIVSRFGMHKHPTLKTVTENSGIDIKAPKGTSIKSISDGVVTTITYIKGFGNTIIIDHGSGFYTVYTHVENVKVTVDQYVSTGTIIAEVGDSGSLEGSLLHFEIWKNKEKLNPEKWLAKIS